MQYVFIRMSIASYVFRIVYCGLMGRQYVECFVYDGLSDTDRKEKPVCQAVSYTHLDMYERQMVGSAIVRELQRQGYTNIVTRTHKELDLTRQDAVEKFFATEKPEYVFLAAAKVGGIVANQNALAAFMYDKMCIRDRVKRYVWLYMGQTL